MSLRRALSSLIHSKPTSAPKPTTSTAVSTKSLSTSAPMADSKTFMDAVRDRRTYYALEKKSPVPDSKILDLVKQTVLHVPSSFNVQSARLVVLLGKDHDDFWDLVGETLKKFVEGDAATATAQKIAAFKGAYGSILFYENQPSIKGQQDAYPMYADKFPQWSEHTSAMHQFVLWAGLEAEGFGANLQHYNPIVNDQVSDKWGVPKDWDLKAQLVFGTKSGDPAGGEKNQTPYDERVKVFGAK